MGRHFSLTTLLATGSVHYWKSRICVWYHKKVSVIEFELYQVFKQKNIKYYCALSP